MLLFAVACILPALITSLLMTAVVRNLAPRWGLIDQPAARKVHVAPTPLGGGLAIFAGVVLPLAVAQLTVLLIKSTGTVPAWLPEEIVPHLDGVLYRSGTLWAILGAGTLLVVMGLLDDRVGVSWKWRLTVQFLLAIGLVAGGVKASIFVSHPWVGPVVTVLWIVALVNSLNFLDNMDGLSAGIALIASVMFAVVMLTGTSEPRWLVAGVLLVMTGSLTGFLWFNWPPASIFMGDAGSTFLGLMLACLTVLGTFYDESVGNRHVILAPLCVLAIPLFDLTTVIWIRLSQGRSPFQPDKSHVSHRLVDFGFDKRDAVLVIHFATMTTGLGALLLYHVDGWAGAALVIALVLSTLTLIGILERVGRHQRLHARENVETQPAE